MISPSHFEQICMGPGLNHLRGKILQSFSWAHSMISIFWKRSWTGPVVKCLDCEVLVRFEKGIQTFFRSSLSRDWALTWPSFTTNIALQFFTVLSLWAMVMLVLPSWALSRALRTLLSLSVSRAEVASSSNRTGGFLIKARAMAILCFWPGEEKNLLMYFKFDTSYPQRAGYPSLPQEFRSPEMILIKECHNFECVARKVICLTPSCTGSFC